VRIERGAEIGTVCIMRTKISLKINKHEKIKRNEERKKKVKEGFISEVIANIQNSEKRWKLLYGTK